MGYDVTFRSAAPCWWWTLLMHRVHDFGVIGHGQGSASDEEELGSRPACSQFRRQVIEKRADVLPPEAGAHARSSAPLVMKTPRRRNEDGDSASARGWRPRRSVTNHQGQASRPGSRAHDGTSHPSRRARYSAVGEHGDSVAGGLVSRLERLRLHISNGIDRMRRRASGNAVPARGGDITPHSGPSCQEQVMNARCLQPQPTRRNTRDVVTRTCDCDPTPFRPGQCG